MPLLRLHSPPLPFEQRKIMAEALSATLQKLTEEPAEQVLIHFCPYPLEQLACEGKLAHETENSVYILELLGIRSSTRLRETLSQILLAQTVDLTGCHTSKVQLYYLDSQSHPSRSSHRNCVNTLNATIAPV